MVYAAENDKMDEMRQDRWKDWVFNSHGMYAAGEGTRDLLIMISMTREMYRVVREITPPPSFYSRSAWPPTTHHRCEVFVL